MPRVSVIIPTHNRPELLRQTLISVSSQTFPDIEIVVVDDGSPDPGAVKNVCAQFRGMQFYRQEKEGRSAARNLGVAASSGELIAFIDDDDLWDADKLQRQVEILQKNAQVDLVHCPVRIIDAAGRETGQTIAADHSNWRSGRVFSHAVRQCIVKSPAPLLRRRAFEMSGGFDVALDHGEDWDLWARIAYRHAFAFIPEPLASHRIHQGTTTDYSDSLSTIRRIRQNLLQFVEPKDRHIVQRELARAALREIPRQTSPRGRQRYAACFEVLRNWPRAAGWRSFWGLMALGGETS